MPAPIKILDQTNESVFPQTAAQPKNNKNTKKISKQKRKRKKEKKGKRNK